MRHNEIFAKYIVTINSHGKLIKIKNVQSINQ
jgi:hypothetical protein